MNHEFSVIVGIDVSKARLDIFADEKVWSVSNDWDSISKLATQLTEMHSDLIVVESDRRFGTSIIIRIFLYGTSSCFS